jgi:protein-disulfide isomerase
MSEVLQARTEQAQAEQAKQALTALSAPIYDDPDHVVLGNPDGDVTLVEFFDYNCGFCRQALADVLQLLDEDKNLRVILKEFPILSQGSADAARVGIVVGRNKDVSYLDFHTAVYATRGQVDKQAALNAAASLGLNPIEVELAMGDDSVTEAITRTYQLADALNITSTPNFIIGDELLRGAVGVEQMKEKIANMRECGKATCNL